MTNSGLAGAARTGTVLVVDADPDLRELAATWLRLHGLDVVTATHGRSATVLLSDPDITCVMVDLPPEGAGDTLALLAAVRDHRPDCRTVVTSVLDEAAYPEADAALPKPFGRARLIAAVLGVTAVPSPRTTAGRDRVPVGGVSSPPR